VRGTDRGVAKFCDDLINCASHVAISPCLVSGGNHFNNLAESCPSCAKGGNGNEIS
jgi:DNA-binding helix-hairpin-helix protein with protein kinase domain